MFFCIVRHDAIMVLTVFHAAQNFPDLIGNKLQSHPVVSFPVGILGDADPLLKIL